MQTAIITGITGQDGYYLSRHLIKSGYGVVGTSRSVCSLFVDDVMVPVYKLDLLNTDEIADVFSKVRPHVVFNLAARASSAQLFDDAVLTAEVNGVSVVRLLEAIRRTNQDIKLCQASSCEIFSGVNVSPQNEDTPKMPINAYGAAKAFADHAIAAYRSTYGMFACSAILYPHESSRRNLHFLVRKVTNAAALISKGLMSNIEIGSLDAVRDWGWADDYMKALLLMTEQQQPKDFVVASGVGHSVKDVCDTAFKAVGLGWEKYVTINKNLGRGLDEVPKIGDATRAKTILGWAPSVSFEDMIKSLVREVL